MTIASVESVKKEFDLANKNEIELEEYINSLKSFSKSLMIRLDNSFKIYKNVINTEAREAGFENTKTLLDELDNSEELKLFVYLFGYYENKFFAPDGTKPLSNLIKVIKLIDKFPKDSRLPWPNVDGFLLFDKTTEEKIKKPGYHDINQDDFLGKIKVFSAEEDIVICNLSDPSYNSRMNDIFKLFINLKIASCIDKLPSVEYINLKENKIISKTENVKTIEHKNKKINLENYVSDLFREVFIDTQKEIKEKKVTPQFVDIDSELWKQLLNQANIIKQQLLQMKAEYINILDHFDSERNELLFEIRNFLIKNKKERHDLKLDERFLPDRNTIESIKGGKGLMKRISASDGGIAEIKKEYPKWIMNKIDMEENIQDAPDANSLNTNPVEPKTENEGEKIINN